jgi:hypothetical protein
MAPTLNRLKYCKPSAKYDLQEVQEFLISFKKNHATGLTGNAEPQ